MTEKIIIAGAGGQGIMLLGKIIAEAAVKEGLFVTWLPAYGAEVRGGTAYCMVVVSDREIGSPFIEEADTLIVMNEPSYAKFSSRLKKNGLLILNTSLIDKEGKKINNALSFPFTDIAAKIGNVKVANMVALGCFLQKKKTPALQTALNVIREIAPEQKEKLVAINQQALNEGAGLIHGKS
ncbi:MAG: 2-oxoacid:acceptor oxidoreductase family protein [Candidatus Omnitrophica bacterium]|nr:2-oxoacid:acceptor oxidoreductase family protein [Candidatus Omnitrophota bacterium]MDD5653606.1 2-oxoacid:acceptor oxidoreductase family protein [Candidatus Omnitrophota bacterium]